MPQLTFPDGSQRGFEAGVSGQAVAESISKSLAKKAVAIKLDGAMRDLSREIERDGAIEIVTRDAPDALEIIRHDCAHVLAEAVQSLWPDTQVTIGPVIENGFYYDFARDEPFSTDDLAAIEAKMREIIARNAPFTREVWSRERAVEHFKAKGEGYKVELIDAIPGDQGLTMYAQGDWMDLCRGPHGRSTGQVGPAFKLLKVAGAYWRGDSDNAMLQRIYGTAFAREEELKDYLHMLEEAEKRDHRRLGREMDLFHMQEEGPGSVFWHPKGWAMYQALVAYMRRMGDAAGYHEINTPDMMERSLWEQSGHWEKFGENMYTCQTPDEKVFALKPMNCPGHVQVFKNGLKSYRDLPLMYSEFGKCHRYEPSGALHGTMRVRHFCQDDAHIFIEPHQIAAECQRVNDLLLAIYRDFGFEDVRIKFSDRPDVRVGDDASWDLAEEALRSAMESVGLELEYNPGEGAFYGPKLEYVLRDAIGRDWQCGTLQVDFNLPGRLGAFYIGQDNEKHTPVMLHRAIFGSLERFVGILIENFAGHLPLWLSPVQAVVCTITSAADDYALEVTSALRKAGLRIETDIRNEKINYKVREHSHAKVPVIIAVGNREAEGRQVSIRRLGAQGQSVMGLDEAIADLREEALAPDLKRLRAGDMTLPTDVVSAEAAE